MPSIIRKVFPHRYLIYVIGIAIWFVISWWLYVVTNLSRIGQFYWVGAFPFAVGLVPLGFNFLSACVNRKDPHTPTRLYDPYKDEVERVGTVQEYGSYVIAAAAVAAAITGSRAPSFAPLMYMGASIVSGLVGLVPVWVAHDNYKALCLLRHSKTVLLTFSTGWLAQAVMIIIAQNFGH
jgi:hypothetical protein